MKKIQGFTLIEMMAVMIIAAVLTALAVPAFKALTTGSSVGETSSILKNSLDVAQSRAISHRQYVAAVIDYRCERKEANDMQAVRLALLKITRDNSGTVKQYKFAGWVPDGQWQVLQYGASLLCAYEDHAKKPEKSGSTLPTQPGDLVKIEDVWKEEVSSGGTFDGYGMIFGPYGSVYQPSKEITFTVGESKIVDGKFIFENTDDDGVPVNILKLTVNQFTGRTEFRNENN
ncbi:MAG: prepilin-type N-terminal cleavage/methylation domain-containing protein [Lentisphaeria bacterium]|nr:prepilin-type N-terminal cleavage/methylation domain-containing protein [Lentisphaeria bacterium]